MPSFHATNISSLASFGWKCPNWGKLIYSFVIYQAKATEFGRIMKHKNTHKPCKVCKNHARDPPLRGNYHSLTHCCTWPAEGRSVLHIERPWLAIWTAPTDRPMSSSTCCSQVLRGRPSGRFQSSVGGVPVWASIDSCSACEAGVFSGRRQMWPNNE